MTDRPFGASLKRVEDARLITGNGRYTNNLNQPGMVHMAVVRSPYAHARILSIDTARAAGLPGVIGVYTGQEMRDAGFGGIPCAWVVPDSDTKTPEHPPVAVDTVRYVGDAVAIVVAETEQQARDATYAVDVDYDVLDAVTEGRRATADGAPQLHDDVDNNLCFHWTVAGGDIDAAFAAADVVVTDTIVNQRLIPMAMEPRAALARWDVAMEELTLWVTSQNPHIARFLLSLDTGIPEHKIRVIAPDVGGGFGSKIPHYPEDSMVIFASQKTGRPVKWNESRSENFQATSHGRDHHQEVEMAATSDGVILGLRAKVWANLGAYLSTAATGVPTILHGLMLSGAYTFPAVHEDVYGVFTNTTPVDAYRGAGRPEATFMVERMMDLVAHEIGMDPAELRRKNLIPPFTDGHEVITGLVYDTGNYEPALDLAMQMVDYPALRKKQAQLRQQGRYVGIGIVTYTEICGLGPSEVAGAVGFGGGLWESAIVRFHPSGKVNVMVGVSPHGQGEATTFAQIVGDQLGLPVGDVEIIYGDTDLTPMGWGTYGSRTTAVAGGAIMGAIAKIKEKGVKIAAHLLEASTEDIEFADGKFSVKGSKDQSMTIQDIALAANTAWDMPEGVEPGLEASAFFNPSNFVYPFGTHIAMVEVDPETGEIELQRYAAVDDCGPIINPMIVEGQIHGGIVQGVGQALWEAAGYDENGNLVTGSLMDYAIPKAGSFPPFELGKTETPTPVNPLGVKGVGETGTIASTPAVYNAVMDALVPLGVKTIDMPMTPERVWRAIRDAEGGH
ncbi:MAG TPA: xanthine dehydrogenase family protein molybdopterin-binding subunit [Acidimicrobiia bacterium]|nr:xanthine dehydrogenase family protein molybdopterin-binding subunit [Acidimicrobiia bacterium]